MVVFLSEISQAWFHRRRKQKGEHNNTSGCVQVGMNTTQVRFSLATQWQAHECIFHRKNGAI